MKKVWKYVLTIGVPVIGLPVLFGSCASTSTCNNDACYERKISSSDPYKEGEIAAWGSEKEVAEQERKKEPRFRQPLRREGL